MNLRPVAVLLTRQWNRTSTLVDVLRIHQGPGTYADKCLAVERLRYDSRKWHKDSRKRHGQTPEAVRQTRRDR